MIDKELLYGVLYGVLAVLAAAVARGHFRAARRAGVPGLLLVGMVYALEAAELSVLWLAVTEILRPGPTIALVVTARLLTILRFGFGQGLLVGASYSRIPVTDVVGVRTACRFIGRGYQRWASTRLRMLFRPRR